MNPVWKKSSHSGGNPELCIEVAGVAPAVWVRDSKNAQGAHLAVPSTSWTAFTTALQANRIR